MKPKISEFSYGYAVTDELIHVHGTLVTAAPVFPTLYEEGQEGGGYDVHIEGPAIPLFLQFKLCHCLTTRNATLAKSGDLSLPYFRMPLMSRRHSRQHMLLLDLEAPDKAVYYCAPGFYTKNEFNDAYQNNEVCSRSSWVIPSTIGPLPDYDEHYIAFERPTDSHFYFCSDPKKIEADFSFQPVLKRLFEKLIAIDNKENEKFDFEQLPNEMLQLCENQKLLSTPVRDNQRIMELPPLQRASAISSMIFACQLYLVTLSENAA